jgi:hypothetical protein
MDTIIEILTSPWLVAAGAAVAAFVQTLRARHAEAEAWEWLEWYETAETIAVTIMDAVDDYEGVGGAITEAARRSGVADATEQLYQEYVGTADDDDEADAEEDA